MAGDVGGQALREGLVDRVILHLVPMVMHTGRSFFGDGGVGATIAFDNPRIVEGDRVTHLVYDLV